MCRYRVASAQAQGSDKSVISHRLRQHAGRVTIAVQGHDSYLARRDQSAISMAGQVGGRPTFQLRPFMSDYRIEKDRVHVTVVTAAGERIAGNLFVQAYARHRVGPEGAPDVMNDEDPFFPLRTDEGVTYLIAKDRVLEVEITPDEVALADLEAKRLSTAVRLVDAEVTLVGGSVVRGALALEVPADRPRLLDFLNRFDKRFVTLYVESGTRLLHYSAIVRVRPLD